jgi:hypothetical protein
VGAHESPQSGVGGNGIVGIRSCIDNVTTQLTNGPVSSSHTLHIDLPAAPPCQSDLDIVPEVLALAQVTAADVRKTTSLRGCGMVIDTQNRWMESIVLNQSIGPIKS